MPIDNRDWYKGKHPPACNCTECLAEKRDKEEAEKRNIASTIELEKTNKERNAEILEAIKTKRSQNKMLGTIIKGSIVILLLALATIVVAATLAIVGAT